MNVKISFKDVSTNIEESLFNVWLGRRIRVARPLHATRYAMMKKRLEKLGYAVSGASYNAADFGVPQQRRRAWLLCIQEAEMSNSSDSLATDMNQFQCRCPSLFSIVDLENIKDSGSKGHRTADVTAKWKKGYEEQCTIYGKVTLPNNQVYGYFSDPKSTN
jgi:site-specific DNA-cytosine methylase